MPKLTPVEINDHLERRTRACQVATAHTCVTIANDAIGRALANMKAAVPAGHPVIAELEKTLLDGRRILARADEILRRVPV